MDDAQLAFLSEPREPAEIEIRVNFGVFAGRDVTHAEIDDLARALYGELTSVAIVAVRRHELADGHEAAAHQVKVEANMRDAREPGLRDELAARLLALTTGWAEACISFRHAEVTEA